MAAFISVWKTDNLSEGSSDADQVSLPLANAFGYDFTVDWGDGTQDTITSWDQSEKTHTYASPGTYTITIEGDVPRWRFSGDGDRLKIVLIQQWGDFALQASAFDGCSNLDCSDDSPVIFADNNPFAVFRGCRSLTKVNVSGWDLSTAGQINSTFDGCRSLEQVIGLETWDVSEITHLLTVFRGCHVLPLSGIEYWNPSSVINLNYLFNATARDLTASDFPDISHWDVRNVTGWNNTFVGSNNSVENYDNILINWSQLPLQPDREVIFPWTRSPVSQAAYDRMVNEHGWTINDNGLSETPINLSAPSIPDEGGADIPITVTPGAWDDRDNGELVLHYQWTVSDDDTATGETNIEGATGPTYTPLPEHVGKYIRVWERGENDGRWDPSEDTPSNFLAVVPAPENLTAPTLQINPDGAWTGGLGTWTNSPTNYAWELRRAADDSVVDSGATSDAGAELSGSGLGIGNYYLWVEASNSGGSGVGSSGSQSRGVAASVTAVFSGEGEGYTTRTGSGSAVVHFSGEGVGYTTHAGSGSAVVHFSGNGIGHAVYAGSGFTAVPFSGKGVGYAIHSGNGSAAAYFSGEGVGYAVHAGSGSAVAHFSGEGVGYTTRSGSGAAAVHFSGEGVGYATRTGSGFTSAHFSGKGVGYAAHSSSGFTSVHFSGKGVGYAIYAGSGFTSVHFSGKGAGHATRSSSGFTAVHFSGEGVGYTTHTGSGFTTVHFSGKGVGHATRSGSGSAVVILTGAGVSYVDYLRDPQSSPFSEVQVFPHIQGGTRVEWAYKVPPNFPTSSRLELQYGSTQLPQADDWEHVADVGLDDFFVLDPKQRVYNNFNWASYRLRLITDREIFYSQPQNSFGVLGRRLWRVAKDVIRQEMVRFRNDQVGREMYLLKRRVQGKSCTNCLDPMTQEITLDDCPVCWGTGIVGGYYPPACCVYVSTTELPMKNELDGGQGRGTIDDSRRVQGRIINIPFLFAGDVLVEKVTDKRWVVRSYRPEVELSGIPLVINAEMRLIEYSHPIYRFPLQHAGPGSDLMSSWRNSEFPLGQDCRSGYTQTEKPPCPPPEPSR